jgi:hypothetical protein
MNDFVLPVTRYALSDDVNIAYQTLGDGPIDLIYRPRYSFTYRFLSRILRVYVFPASPFKICSRYHL